MPAEAPGQGGGISASLAQRAARSIPGGANSNFRLAPPQRFWAWGKGSHITDVDGNEFVDYVLGMGADFLGHSPAAILDSVSGAQEKLQCPAGQQLAEIELAEKIIELVPSGELVRVGCTGSEMIQLAIRLSRAATARSLIVKFEGHYHGWFDNIFAGTVVPADRPARANDAVAQTAGQASAALADLVILPWNDLEILRSFFESRGDEIAAVIMEPVLCNTSVIVPGEGYLAEARALCTKHGAVLVFDEVITGFRLSPGGAQARLGVTPDLTVLGKALGAGFPVAAITGNASLMNLVGDGTVMHGGTYNANAMSIAAACAALRIISDPEIAVHDHLESLGGSLVAGLQQASRAHGGRLNVQGIGAVLNTTFSSPGPVVDYRSYQASDLAAQRQFVSLMDQEGVRITSRGTWFLSSAHTSDDVIATLEAVDRALKRMEV